MSALEDRKHRHLARPLARNLVNDDDLRYLVGRRHTTALHVMMYVRKRAVLKGRLQVAVTNVELEQALGVDRRAIQRAKAHLRERGFPIEERTGRHQGRTGKSGSLACMFVLDRREVEALKPRLSLVRDEEHGGAVLDAVHVREENTTPPSAAYAEHSVGLWPAASRAGPPPEAASATDELHGAAATPALPCVEPPRAAASETRLPRAADFEREITLLREWVTPARGSALTGQRAAELLDRAERHLLGLECEPPLSPFAVKLARSMLEAELGAGQLELGVLPATTPRSRVDADAGQDDDSSGGEDVRVEEG